MWYYIKLSKVLVSDLWDVVATYMSGGPFNKMNTKLHAKEETREALWGSWTDSVASL